ncbi:MAG: Y-family DNA polymerase [Balneolaceae bacterium]
MSTAYALIDCNNFYASCERVFDPTLKNRPLVILSNNDGCVIARSKKAKEMGVEMGVPEFKIRALIHQNKIVVRSSNYALYGDMSNRVMESLRSLTPNIEVYSIDEAFAELSTQVVPTFQRYGKELRQRTFKWTGMPVSVGIAPTKTLAKIANEVAKSDPKREGVMVLADDVAIEKILRQTPVSDIWGVGRKYSLTLNRHGIRTAWELSCQSDAWIKSVMKITGLRTVLELRGTPCLRVDETIEPRKGILSSRSFGKPVTELFDLKEAVSSFTSRAAEKLRAQFCVASNMSVVLVTNKFENQTAKYKFGVEIFLPNPTADTPTLSEIAGKCVEQLFVKGKKYKKAWIMLTGIIPQQEMQGSLFEENSYSKKQHSLMESMDGINAKFGKRTMSVAGSGIDQPWQMKQQYLSKRYTTDWGELMEVNVF